MDRGHHHAVGAGAPGITDTLIGATQLADLAFHLGDALLLSSRHARPLATIDLGLAHPALSCAGGCGS